MKVELVHSTPLQVAEHAARTCTRTRVNPISDKIVPAVDYEFLRKLWEAGHYSVFEHINYTFLMTDMPRGLLQQLARHRHTSLSVESTRYTLKARVEELLADGLKGLVVEDYDKLVSLSMLNRILAQSKNDEAKMYVPDWFPTELVLTTNLRELDHIITLRTRPEAWKPFRDLCYLLLRALPAEALSVSGLDILVNDEVKDG